MKRYILMILLSSVAIICSCSKDAVLIPNDNNNINGVDPEVKYFGKVWYFEKSNDQTISAIPAFKLTLNAEKTSNTKDTMITLLDYGTLENSFTELSKNGDEFQFKFRSFSYKYKIVSYTNTSMTVSISNDGGITYKNTGVYRTQNKVTNSVNLINVSGAIDYEHWSKIKNAHIYLLFKMKKGNSQEIIYNHLEGEIKSDPTYGYRFNFKVNKPLPDIALMESSFGGKFGYGEILLVSKELPLNQDVSIQLQDSTIKMGVLNKYGIAWKSGAFSNGKSFKWQDAFNDGYSIGYYTRTDNKLEPNAQNKVWISPRHWVLDINDNSYSHNFAIFESKWLQYPEQPIGWYY